MKKCKHCQKEIDKKATRCPYCHGDLRAWPARHPILTTIITVFVILVIIGANSPSSKTGNNASSKTGSSASQSTISPTTDPNPHFSDGVFQIGKDIQPGTYRLREKPSGCYYERLKGFGGSVGDIISNENTSAYAIVTINATDKGFKSQNCGYWTQDLSAVTTNKTTFDDGMFIVGTDIEPGTYKNTGSTGCYYARLSGFEGGIGEIIANENTDTSAIVTIGASDKGFTSHDCGTWTLMK